MYKLKGSKAEKPLSTLLQELVSSSPRGCLSTCEAVRALRRMAPPMLKNLSTIRLRKKITDCLTRNPAFTIALDHLRHGIRPRYALQGTDVAVLGGRFSAQRHSKKLAVNNDSYTHSVKTGDRLIREVFEGKRKDKVYMTSSTEINRNSNNLNLDRSPLNQSITNTNRLSPVLNNNTQVGQGSPTVSQQHPVYTIFPSTPRFPKVNFPDLLTPPDSNLRHSTSDLITRNRNYLAELNSVPHNLATTPYTSYDLSPNQYNLLPFHTPLPSYDLGPVQCNLFPFTTPPQFSEITRGFLPHLSSDEVIECLTL